MMPENLQETIRSVMNGDHAAFRNIVLMHQQPAYRIAFRILGNEEEARDAVQECFIRVWQKIGSFDPSREFAPWMYRILVNASVDRLRVIQRHDIIPIGPATERLPGLLQDDHDVSADNHELALLVKGIADQLPGIQKVVFILRDIEGMASDEVETITELSETSVKTNLYHARKKVRERLLQILEKERRTR
jgi:RNA polymerase sigma-70 factor (ECF subfamily)